MQVSADANAGANANAGHSEAIEQSSLDNHHGVSQNIVDEENDVQGIKQADRDIGANMETHGKALKAHLDDSDSVQKGPNKGDPTTDGGSQVGDEGDMHDMAHSRQP